MNIILACLITVVDFRQPAERELIHSQVSSIWLWFY